MFLRLLTQSFRRQRRRKLLAALAVLAGMTVTTAMLTVRVNLADDLSAELERVGANILITPAADSLPVTLDGMDLRPAGAGALLPESDLPKIKTIFWTNNIAAFAPILDTQADVSGVPVTIEGSYFNHNIMVPGSGQVIRTGLERLDGAWNVTGAWPADDSHQVLVGATLARRLGLGPGSDGVASADGRRLPFQVTGVLRSGGGEDNLILASLHWVQTLAGEPGKLRQIRVAAITKPDDAFARRDPAAMSPADRERWMCSPYARTIALQLQQALPGASAAVLRPVAASEGAIVTRLRALLWLVTAMALLASMLAIGSAMTAAVLERRDEIALMKAMGAQDASIAALLTAEAALLGLGCGALGYLLGGWLAQGIAYQLLGHTVAWKPALAPLILLLAGAVTLLGSLQPLRRALRVDPAVILRGAD